MEPIFHDRRDAGRKLAKALELYRSLPDPVVLALPRGGVPVGYEVARAFDAPLDVFLVKKLGLPGNEELAMGAVASGGVRVLNEDLVQRLRIPNTVIATVALAGERELLKREHEYRGVLPMVPIKGKSVILVDDGLATGSTMRAAVLAVRKLGPKRIIVAVPIAASDTCEAFRSEVDGIVCATTPEPLFAIGFWYKHFDQIPDTEVHYLLENARNRAEAQVA